MPSKFAAQRTDSMRAHPSTHAGTVQLALLVLGSLLLSVAIFGPGIPGFSSISKNLGGCGVQIGSRHLVGGDRLWRRAARLAINYAHNCCQTSQPKSCASMLDHGARRCISYNESALDDDFRKRNSKILQQGRGAGFWLWKPYIILKTLLYEMEEGDVLLYSDAGAVAIGDLRPLYELAAEQDIVIFQGNPKWHHRERQWTKPDVFTLMGCPVEECGQNLQVDASVSVWKKSYTSIQFVSQWLGYMEDPRISTDSLSTVVTNATGFAEHRHDQSCVGLLMHRWNLVPANHSHIESTFDHNRDRS